MKKLALTLIILFTAVPAYAEKQAEPNYITDADFKKKWVERIELPRRMDRDYHKVLRERKAMIETVESGKMDKEAILAAAQYNQALAVNAGDEEKARLYALQVESASKVIEAQKLAEAANRASKEAMYIRMQLEHIQIQMMLRQMEGR